MAGHLEIEISSKKYPGLVATVDDEDAEIVSIVRTWCVRRGYNTFYATGHPLGSPKGTMVEMHRLILPDSVQADHIDGNGLNNQRSNVRPATPSQNGANRPRPNRNNTLGFRGIKRNGSGWSAQIRILGKRTHLGTFRTPEEAARAYDAKAIEAWGSFATTNFPAEAETWR